MSAHSSAQPTSPLATADPVWSQCLQQRQRFAQASVLILGHGSSKHPDSSLSCRQLAVRLRALGLFAQVELGFLKEQPSVEGALARCTADEIFVVPVFLAEGYFTKRVIPQMLGLEQGTNYLAGKTIHLCQPLGVNPRMQELLVQTASALLQKFDLAGNSQLAETAMLLVGHGSTKSKTSTATLKWHRDEIRQLGLFQQVEDVYLEEPVFVKDWRQSITASQLVVVAFLIANGQHGGWDIPEDMGIDISQPVIGRKHQLDDQTVYLASAVGTQPEMLDVLLAELVRW
ncbi:CbiX/SirB N-terminal domain-containing protein [Persicirhabdus sediminis]|uniref:Sirohydrochlorin ferrochelatase n=1 Tax=Persicirhabdus sediminis TaxID=454144 RepID=A0A8J7MD44_9BACT|nr:CbiX/SirB N-terminal domain-containing protein [Persicirhabdus sediminis]MBK1790932.1 hypothetical protein [Persicirhabdus sediminis]